jgi:hypothetical protein
MLIDALLLIGGMLALGVLSRRLALFPEQAGEVFNRFVLDICLPALVYLAVTRLEWDRRLVLLIVLPVGLAVLSWALVRLVARWRGWSRQIEGCLVLVCMLGNTAFMGYPMVQGLLGTQALSAAVVYDQLGTFVTLSTLGLAATAYYGGQARPSAAAVALKFLRFPAFIALVLAFLPLPEPDWLMTLLERIASLLVPLALFAVGLAFRLVPPREEMAPLVFGLSLKMLLWPLLAWTVLAAVAAPEPLRSVGVLQSAMPSMVTAGALAMRHKLAPNLAAAMVGYGVLLALPGLPLLAWVLGGQ